MCSKPIRTSGVINGGWTAVYQDALEQEFLGRQIPFQREHPVPVIYKERMLSTPYRADFVCFGCVIVELKAIKKLTENEDAQVLHYLKATGLERALLLNFAAPRLEYKRFLSTRSHLRPSGPSAVNPNQYP